MVQYQGWLKDIVIFTALYGWYCPMKASCISDIHNFTSYFRICILNSGLGVGKAHKFIFAVDPEISLTGPEQYVYHSLINFKKANHQPERKSEVDSASNRNENQGYLLAVEAAGALG